MNRNARALDINMRHLIGKLALIVIVCSAAVSIIACNEQEKSSGGDSDLRSKMSQLIKQHKFDESAQVGLQRLTGKPSDGWTYYLLALGYAERAQYEPKTKTQSLRLVDQYSEKGLSIDPTDELNRFNIAWVLQYAGGVDGDSRCLYYQRAVKILSEIGNNSSTNTALKKQAAALSADVQKKMRDTQCAPLSAPGS